MTQDVITVVRAGLTDEVSRALIGALNAELASIYTAPGATHFHLDPEETSPGRGAFLVAYRGDTPVGCGALRRLDAETGELKRMYVAPSERGRGVGRRLVAELEAAARALGVRRLVLETGVHQHAALALYRATGFRTVPLYGEYVRSPGTSVCLGKELAAARMRSPRYVLAVPNLAASAAYYRDVLGFQVHEIGDPGWRVFTRDAVTIMAGECPDALPPRETGDHSYFAYVEVEPIDDFYAGVVARGAEVVKPIRDEPWRMREFGIRTADGHRIMFGSPCAAA